MLINTSVSLYFDLSRYDKDCDKRWVVVSDRVLFYRKEKTKSQDGNSWYIDFWSGFVCHASCMSVEKLPSQFMRWDKTVIWDRVLYVLKKLKTSDEKRVLSIDSIVIKAKNHQNKSRN